MLLEAIKLYGVAEMPGESSNGLIMSWADEIGVRKSYINDSIPWCGLFMAIVAKRAGKTIVENPLWALNWKNFGTPVKTAMLGDVLIFPRNGGNHVGIYVAENKTHYYVLGGNQGNKVCIMPFEKKNCKAIRRPIYKVQPTNVRIVNVL
ncbi:TIGR02594 family protein [Chitinophaga skermanii]|nr:TIGR02594 family protein [Chitinophaga skermanii]